MKKSNKNVKRKDRVKVIKNLLLISIILLFILLVLWLFLLYLKSPGKIIKEDNSGILGNLSIYNYSITSLLFYFILIVLGIILILGIWVILFKAYYKKPKMDIKVNNLIESSPYRKLP